MKLFVTGGNGFIGKNYQNTFTKHEYYIFDKALPYRDDVCSVDSIIKRIQNFKPDCIVHLASLTNVVESIKKPMLYFKENIEGLLNILSVAKAFNIPLLFTSSCGADDPINPYSQSKNLCECICENSEHNVTILRLTNVYGKKYSDKKTSAVHKFYRQIENGIPVTVNGDGNQTRDFINVRDVCFSIELAIRKIKNFNMYEIGSGLSLSVNALIKEFEKHKVFDVKHIDSIKGELQEVVISTRKAKEEIGFDARVKIWDGIKGFYENR